MCPDARTLFLDPKILSKFERWKEDVPKFAPIFQNYKLRNTMNKRARDRKFFQKKDKTHNLVPFLGTFRAALMMPWSRRHFPPDPPWKFWVRFCWEIVIGPHFSHNYSWRCWWMVSEVAGVISPSCPNHTNFFFINFWMWNSWECHYGQMPSCSHQHLSLLNIYVVMYSCCMVALPPRQLNKSCGVGKLGHIDIPQI